MTELQVGDIVRIRTKEECSRNRIIQPDSPMDVWSNEYCVINKVLKRHYREKDEYKISFLYEDSARAKTACHLEIEAYLWTEDCFIKENPVEIEESVYENLIGGIL